MDSQQENATNHQFRNRRKMNWNQLKNHLMLAKKNSWKTPYGTMWTLLQTFWMQKQFEWTQENNSLSRQRFPMWHLLKIIWRKGHLIRHIQIVYEGNKDFRCNQCSEPFAERRDLLKHMKVFHKETKDF